MVSLKSWADTGNANKKDWWLHKNWRNVSVSILKIYSGRQQEVVWIPFDLPHQDQLQVVLIEQGIKANLKSLKMMNQMMDHKIQKKSKGSRINLQKLP